MYRVVASDDNTVVTVNGATVATLAKGDFYEGPLPAGADVEATKPVLVTQYLIDRPRPVTIRIQRGRSSRVRTSG